MVDKRKGKFRSTHRKRYTLIVTALIILFFVFQLISNFTIYVLKRESEIAASSEVTLAELDELREKKLRDKKDEEDKKKNFLLVGEESQLFILLKNQLTNMKETYESVEFIETIKEDKKGIFLTKEHFEESEIVLLKEAAKKGITLYFLKIPLINISEDLEFRELLGIRELRESGVWNGIRFISNFLISDMIEYPNYELELIDLSLKQGTKTYAYSLFLKRNKGNGNIEIEEDNTLRNEELPSIIWRNTYLYEGKDGSYVFCVNGNSLIESREGAGIITALLSYSEEDYIYPIINAYNFIVKGMPSITNYSNEKLMKLYGKDALGIQQDILTPQIFSYVNKYQLFPTYLSKDANKISNDNGSLAKYFNNQVMVQLGELYQYEEQEGRLYINDKTIGYEAWSSNFRFDLGNSEYETEGFLPLIQNSNYYEVDNEFSIISATTAFGFVSIYTDIEEVLKEDNKQNWVDVGKKLGTLLSVQSQKLNYLDRMKHTDTVKRLMKYQLLETNIEKYEEEIVINLDYFAGEAFFILRTTKEILEVENGSYSKIGDNRYLIEFFNHTARIIFR